MAIRYRVVFVAPKEEGVTVDVIEAETAAQAIEQLKARYPDSETPPELVSIRVDSRDPAPAASPVQLVAVLEALARALLRENTVLLALLNNPVFASSLSPMRLASLQEVTIDAQLALTLAQQLGISIEVKR